MLLSVSHLCLWCLSERSCWGLARSCSSSASLISLTLLRWDVSFTSGLELRSNTSAQAEDWEVVLAVSRAWRAASSGEPGSSWWALCATWWATTSSASPSACRWCSQQRWASWVRGIHCQNTQLSYLISNSVSGGANARPLCGRTVDRTHHLRADAVHLLPRLPGQTGLGEGGRWRTCRSGSSREKLPFLCLWDAPGFEWCLWRAPLFL